MPSKSENLRKAVLLHPGTQYSFNLAIELHRKNLLDKYITSFSVSSNSILYRLFKERLNSRLLREVPAGIVRNYPMLEAKTFIKSWINGGDSEDILYERNLEFQKTVIRNDLKDAHIVIGFDTSSWKIADFCKANGKKFILDVSIGHPVVKEQIFKVIRAQFADWNDISNPKKNDRIELEVQEFELADLIVVPSHFVSRTLISQGVDEKKIRINPFGTDLNAWSKAARKNGKDKVTFLFFGSLTARKGLPLLLAAWDLLNPTDAKLIIAGYGQIPETVNLKSSVHVLGPIQANGRLALFEMADVFVFPSYFEGLAQVQIEAAASGLPVIGTSNSGAEELVKNGESGFIIEPGHLGQLVAAMKYFIENPDHIRSMSRRIRERSDFFSWNAYGDRWHSILNEAL